MVRENLFSVFHIRIVDRPSSHPHSLYHPPRFSHSPSVAMSPDPTSLSSLGPSTRAVHVGNRSDETTGAVLQPLTLSTTFQAEHTQRPVQLSVIFACSSSRARSRLELNLLFALICSCWLDRAFSASLGLRLSLELARCASSPLTATPLPRPPLSFAL